MNENKKEGKMLKTTANSHSALSKAQRNAIKDPTKLCDCCMNEWTFFSVKEEKLCDECYGEKYVKAEMG